MPPGPASGPTSPWGVRAWLQRSWGGRGGNYTFQSRAANCGTSGGPGRSALTASSSVWCPAAGSAVAFSPGNLSTSSSASSTLGSPENEEYILSFETIDKMRRVSSYSALNSLIGEPPARPPLPAQHSKRQVHAPRNRLGQSV